MAFLKFQLEDGTIICIESTDPAKSSPGLIPSSRSEDGDSGKPAVAFEGQIDSLQKMASAMMKKFREGFIEEPSDIDISFGLKASTEANGFIVARAGVDSAFSVSLHWRDRKKETKSE